MGVALWFNYSHCISQGHWGKLKMPHAHKTLSGPHVMGTITSLKLPGVRGQVFGNRALAPLTTWKVGGPAHCLITPCDLEDVMAVCARAHREGCPLFFLGRGSNLWIADSGVPGITLHLADSLQQLDIEGDILTAGAGVALPKMARFLADRGWGGFEFLTSIPGTVGAAVRINAGTGPGQEIGTRLVRVSVLTPSLEVRQFTVMELDMGYRYSRLLHFPHWLVVGAQLRLTEKVAPQLIKARMEAIRKTRKAKFPVNPRTCGSVFKNPPGGPPAGWLIDQAGLKGTTCGDAQVAPEHANFIVNRGKATAGDIRELIDRVQEAVWRVHGIELKREVVFWPDDVV